MSAAGLIKPDASRVASTFGITMEQAKAALARNAASLRWMAERAVAKGGKYNGYTAEELRRSAEQYAEAAR